jgi:hypothetical protein
VTILKATSVESTQIEKDICEFRTQSEEFSYRIRGSGSALNRIRVPNSGVVCNLRLSSQEAGQFNHEINTRFVPATVPPTQKRGLYPLALV